MKQLKKRLDIVILLGSLLLFGLGIGIIYGEQKTPVTLPEKKFASDQQILNLFSANFSARNVKEIGGLLSRAPFDQQLRVLEKIIKNENIILDHDDKAKLLLYVALKNTGINQNNIFDLLLQYPALLDTPLLYQAAAYKYGDLIPDILTWLQKDPDKKRLWIMQAFQATIQEDKPTIMLTLFQKGVPIANQEATELLWQAITDKKNKAFVSLLTKKGAYLNDARNGATLLIAAVNSENLAMVKALLDNGASIQLIKDPAIGSALQTAIARGHTPIEMLLRKYGARE